MTKRNSLISYAMSFASFLLDSTIGNKINRIILFGSVARGDFDENSDIDIFIDTDANIEKELEKQLLLFRVSNANKVWELKGIKNEMSIKSGNLKKWSIRRAVISSGIMLYGKYNEMPENVVYYGLIRIDLRKIKSSKQMSIWRKLYGYKQKIGNKIYIGNGIVKKNKGMKLGKAVFLVPMENRKEIMDFLKQNKIDYTINELWSDSF